MSQVKRMIFEMYDATIKKFNVSMQKIYRIADVPIGYVNADLRTSRVSGFKYLGEFWLVHDLSQGWSLQSDAGQSTWGFLRSGLKNGGGGIKASRKRVLP